MIPKIFHLTSAKKDLPPRFQKNVDILKDLYPEYEIRIHDDADIMSFVTEHFPDYYRDVLQKMPKFIMIVDTVRYMWMKHYGGIYCDMDLMFRERFEFDHGAILLEREWTHPKDPSITTSVHNCWFASVPGHPIWTEILDGVARNIARMEVEESRAARQPAAAKFLSKAAIKLGLRERPAPAVFNLTGPNAISRIITERSLAEKFDDVRILPPTMLFQPGWSKRPQGGEIFVHEISGSWNV